MAATNDITGDSLQSKSNSDSYRDGWERIFGNKKEQVTDGTSSSDTKRESADVDGDQSVSPA